MLTSDELDILPNGLLDLYEKFTQSIINDIVRRLVKSMRVTSTAAWQMTRITQSGLTYENALEEIARLTGRSEKELAIMFKEAGVRSLKYDDNLYRIAGFRPISLNLSPSMLSVLEAGYRKTNGLLKNLTLTTAQSAQTVFIDALDKSYLQVSSGSMSYDQAIREAVKDIASQGLSMISYPSGRNEQIDVSVRRATLTGVSQTTGNLQMARASELGCDLVQTSAHAGSRPEHEPWQGKVFSLSGADPDYPDFVSETDYGSITGLMGINCRHVFFPFFKGISENAYSQADVDEMNSKTVTLDGKEVSQYEASQVQRGIERKIRDWKRQAGALEAAGLSNDTELGKVSQWQAQMRDFIKQTKLQRQRIREQI